MAITVVLEEFGKAFIPKKVRPHLREYILKAGFNNIPYNLFGALFWLSIIATGVAYIKYLYPIIQQNNPLIFGGLTFAIWMGIPLALNGLFMLLIAAYLNLKIFNRTKEIEGILQEFLRYVSENLKGGMSFDKALWDAIRPRFGILADEIRLVAKKSLTGQDLEVALEEFTRKYDSPVVARTFNLIIEGIRGGSPIAELIDRIEQNLRETRELMSEINATNSAFTLFLTFIVVIIAPTLFGLSFSLLIILGTIGEKLAFATEATADTMDSGLALGEIQVNPEQFQVFSMWALGIISVFTAMINATIQKGSIKQGIRFIPAYVIGSLVTYLILKTVFAKIFGGMI